MSNFFDNNYRASDGVMSRISQKVSEVGGGGHEMVLAIRYNNLVDEFYLYYVIARRVWDDTYILWLYNDSQGGLCNGHYDMNIKEALSLLADKVNYIEG